MKIAVASLISYQIKNPLPYLMHLVYLAQMNKVVSTIHGNIDAARSESERSVGLIERLFKPKKHPSSPSVTPRQVLATVLGILGEELRNSGVQIEAVCYDDTPLAIAAREVEEVLIYLIQNAVKAMPHGGQILLRVRLCTQWSSEFRGVCFTIADNGSGMTEAEQDSLFQIFRIAHEFEEDRLALWMSKQTVERHRGKISVRSSQNPAHRGTVFQVFLPL